MANLETVLERLREQRDETARELTQLDKALAVLGGGAGANHAGRGAGRRGRRRMSAAARRRIAAAQKARWAKWKAERRKKAA